MYRTLASKQNFTCHQFFVSWAQFAEGNEDPLGEPVQVDLTQVEAWDIHETAAEYVEQGASEFLETDLSLFLFPSPQKAHFSCVSDQQPLC